MKIKILRQSYSLLSLIMLLNGCNIKKSSDDLILRDIWKIEQTQINSFDPLDAYHAYHIQLVKQIFNTLTDVDSSGNITPSLAKSWETTDGKTWIFHIRDDVYFAKDTCFENDNERLLVADDIKYTFERLLNKESKSLGVSYFINLVGAKEYHNGESDNIVGIRVLNMNTIEIKLANQDFSFPNLLSLAYCSIIKKKAIIAYNCKQHPVGTGPFVLNDFSNNKSITLIKNSDYWEKDGSNHIPTIKQVEITLTTDDNYSFLLFKNQKSNLLEMTLPLLKQIENNNIAFNYSKLAVSTSQLNFYLFNLDKIKDSRTRLGISYAIDRIKMQELLGSNGTVSYSLYPNMFKELSKPNILLESNPEKARELINHSFKLKLVTFDDLLSRSLANQIKEDLYKYSIDIDIESVPFSVLVDRLTSGNYDLIQLYWGMLYSDVNHFLSPFKSNSFPPEGNNFNKYSNSKFDSLLYKAAMIPSHDQSRLYSEAENIILNDMPFILAYYKNSIYLSDNKFNIPINPLLYKFYKYVIPSN